MATNGIQIISPAAKAVFPNLLETEKYDGMDTGKYSVTMMFNPEDIKPIEKAIAEANGGKGNTPLKQIPDDAQYDAGMYKIKAKTQHKIRVFNRKKEKIDAEDVQMGAEIRAQLTFKPYSQQGGGVTCYLGDIQVLKEGKGSGLDFGDLPDGFGEFEEDDLPF